MGGIPDLLVKLKDVPDFYVDMTWEFTSWLPLVSRLVVLVFFSHPVTKMPLQDVLPLEGFFISGMLIPICPTLVNLFKC